MGPKKMTRECLSQSSGTRGRNYRAAEMCVTVMNGYFFSVWVVLGQPEENKGGDAGDSTRHDTTRDAEDDGWWWWWWRMLWWWRRCVGQQTLGRCEQTNQARPTKGRGHGGREQEVQCSAGAAIKKKRRSGAARDDGAWAPGVSVGQWGPWGPWGQGQDT